MSRKQFTGKAILPLFITLTLAAPQAFSQNYHYKVATAAQCNALDSIVAAAHLQVSIRQMDSSSMRFRITIQNPNQHAVSISIHHGNDILFEDIAGKAPYDYVYNLSDLEDGDYLIVVSSGKEKISRNIRIQTDTRVDRLITVD
ncbi:hypothetical protein [Puia dinghuensis]|uniref:Secretion system C-terminal sorting domain-containing protein n=1 Tax=Puia dinghuensis TaxID=1792502 RepID=A0A8J2UDM0_9BACT|nr:hypothetical protein [Puia dinghuensis]GGB03052.1 hypothetical protein GCM10011511_27940 [Puia dinghuensis]